MDIYAHTREAVRVKVKKCEPNLPPEWRKFSVDPQITTLEVLYSLLAKAFDIKSDFSIKYKAFDPAGNEIYLSVLSDWDLDAAFLRIYNIALQTSTEPCLTLEIEVKPFTEVKEFNNSIIAGTKLLSPSSALSPNSQVSKPYDELSNAFSPSVKTIASTNNLSSTSSGGTREIIAPLQQSIGVSQKYVQHMQTKLPGLIMNQMEKTFSMVQKAFNLNDEGIPAMSPRPPLADTEFRMFLDALGQIQRTDELRKVIFFGGIEPSLRRVVWKHILNVYPGGMNGHQRMEYMRQKSEHYYKLRETWKTAVKNGCVNGELAYVTSMVKKDVLRTDRLHAFYAGNDDNQNIASLFNILTTYALNHPSVSYCQGMSDIASPLLVTMNDEAQAYICFCAVMSRVRGNFLLDGISMTQKFTHLTEALSFYDPEFWEYLKKQQADDLLFCYRWLLLELKREFPFDDALRMLEVQWSSLKYETSKNQGLKLFEKEFAPITESVHLNTADTHTNFLKAPQSPSYMLPKPRESPYTKVCALRRQSSSASLSSLNSSLGASTSNVVEDIRKLDTTKRLNQSLDDNMQRRASRQRRKKSAKAHQSLDESKMLMLSKRLDKTLDITDVNTSEDTDDDVFSEGQSINDVPEFIQFHPTNPFKEDALKSSFNQQQQQQIPIATSLPRAFDDSAPSSVADDGSTQANEKCSEYKLNKTSPLLPRSISKLQHSNVITNYNAVSNIISKQLSNAATVSDTMKLVAKNSSSGHFKELKEKLAASGRLGISNDDTSHRTDNESTQQQKLVKNFNEFLNFASISKSRLANKISDSNVNNNGLLAQKLNTTANATSTTSLSSSKPATKLLNCAQTQLPQQPLLIHHPVVQVKKFTHTSSLDDSDSTSSIPDMSWSNSTGATAIQQGNTLSNSQSLNLELNSQYTPDRTPSTYSPLKSLSANDESSKAVEAASVASYNEDDDENAYQEYLPISTSITRELRLEAESLDRQMFGDSTHTSRTTTINSGSEIEYEKLGKESIDLMNNADMRANSEAGNVCKLLAISEKLSSIEKMHNNSAIDNYRLEFDNENDDDGDGNNDFNDDFDAVLQSSSNINEESARRHTNPFIVDDENAGHSANVPNMTDGVIGMAYSNSFPEVLVPVSTSEENSGPPLPIELATNASDIVDIVKAKTKSIESAVYGSSNNNNNKLTENILKILPTTTPTIAPPPLPPPTEFGGGNPFLMFLCLTLLLQHRNTIMKNNMDYNEIAMHFDKMIRKHDVTRVLNQARRMYIEYLKEQNVYKQRLQTIARTTSDLQTSTSSSNENRNVAVMG